MKTNKRRQFATSTLPALNAVHLSAAGLAVVSLCMLTLAGCGGGQGSSIPASTTGTNSGQPAPTANSGLLVPQAYPDATGTVLTVSSTGTIDHSNAFFQPMGNGRACVTCHQESQGWTVTPAVLQARFTASDGDDPIFYLVDGANSPNQLVNTLAERQAAFSVLLSKGLIRVGLPMPTVADFQLQSVDDPYDYASAQELSLYRRPLPATNLGFLSTVMWDGRETLSDAGAADCIRGANPAQCFATLPTDLQDQANNAAKTHEQVVAGLTAAQQLAIVGFETSLFTAQSGDQLAGSLSADGASGGPSSLSTLNYYFGINDPTVGDYQTGVPFTRNVMTIFSSWLGNPPPGGFSLSQASIARGEAIFNTRPFTITGVNGLNDTLGQPTITGTCTSCHSTPEVGSASTPRLLDIGVSAAALRTPDLPLYTFVNNSTGATIQVSDPGAALLSGKWEDIGKFKVPGLRALAARPPYFHNGSAPTLQAVVNFYNQRFAMGLSPQENTDLVAFLQAL